LRENPKATKAFSKIMYLYAYLLVCLKGKRKPQFIQLCVKLHILGSNKASRFFCRKHTQKKKKKNNFSFKKQLINKTHQAQKHHTKGEKNLPGTGSEP